MRSRAIELAEKETPLRQEKHTSFRRELEKWMDAQLSEVRPSSALGKALAYAKPRWAGLSAYTNHGQIEIDNNLVENSIRPLAIGRKNYLFAGSHQAAEMTGSHVLLYGYLQKA